jgi:hypothetical protein
MRNQMLAVFALLLALGFGKPARADFDIEGTLLVGSGADMKQDNGNVYALQVGGALELIINGIVVGGRATRAFSSSDQPTALDLRAIGGDLGYEWELWLLHIGPRVGLGYISTRRKDEFSSFYVEPGVVAEIEIGWFVAGADARYRVVTEDMDRNGFLVYGKIGLRF